MTYKVTYNGFGTRGSTDTSWDHIQVQSYTSKPLFSEDDQTHWTTHHTLSFTALLKCDSGNIDDVLNNCKKKLSKQGRRLLIEVNDGSADNTIADTGIDTTSNLSNLTTGNDVVANTDQRLYPRISFTINKFYGNKNAMVSVTVEWRESIADTVDDAENQWFVLSHQWRQAFNIQENGLQSWTVEGTIHVKPYLNSDEIGSEASTDVLHGTNPDAYRRVVMPMIPSNFRIQSMNWGIDPTGEKLVYRIVLQEHARALPKPGKVGSGSFRFKKSVMGGGGGGLLGTKVFDAELEGDANCDERALLAALLSASEARINWTPPQQDWVQSIEIREIDIFSKKRIGINIIAQGMDKNVTASMEGLASGNLPDAGFGIFTKFVDDNQEAIAPDPYGSALIGAYKKKLFITHGGYTNVTFPKAYPTKVNGESSNTTEGTDPYSNVTLGDMEVHSAPPFVENTYKINGDSLSDDQDESPHGDLTGGFTDDAESDISQSGKVLRVEGSERLGVKHNTTVFSASGTAGAYHVAWQTGAPEIYLESEYTISRHDVAPPMLQYKLPQNAVVLDEQTSVDSGQMDGSGHKLYTRHIKRKVQLLYGYETDDVEEVITTSNWVFNMSDVSFTLNYSYPKIKRIFRAIDIRTDDVNQITNNNVLDGIQGSPREEFFPVSFSIPIRSE